MSRPLTQRLIAQRAGVSVMTVSRVLSRPDSVAAETRDRVLRVIADGGYIMNRTAQALTLGRTGIIGILVSTLANSIFAETIDGAAAVAKDAGYEVLLGDIGYSVEEEERTVRTMLARQPDGLIMSSTIHSADTVSLLRTAGLAVVEVWDLPDEPLDMAVGFSNLGCGRLAAEHLLAAGRTNLAFFGAKVGRDLARWEGFLATARERTGRSPLFIPDALDRNENEFSKGAEFWALADTAQAPVDGLFCASDALAAGVVFEGLRRGVRIPQALAVIGHGDLPFAAHMVPALSSIRVPSRRMGETAARLIVDRKQGLAMHGHVADLGIELICRETG